MTSIVVVHGWSEESLFCKARLYIGEMETHNSDDWRFGLWSSLSLEFLCRAALSHISPVLLADYRNRESWRNLAHALSMAPTTKNFSPKSIAANEMIERLKWLMPAFSDEVAGFCLEHISRRNSELHSGELVFASLGTSTWLPKFYSACKLLLASMNKELTDLISDPESAQAMVDSLKDTAAKGVKRDIDAYRQVWTKRSSEDRERAAAQADLWATKHAGHRVQCPSCGSGAILQGEPRGQVTTTLNEDNDIVIQRQSLLPSSFECISCGLRISGLSRLSACGLGNAFSEKTTNTAAEFFGLYTEDDLEEARAELPYEPDYNE